MARFVCNLRKLSYIPKILSSNVFLYFRQYQTFQRENILIQRNISIFLRVKKKMNWRGEINLMSGKSLLGNAWTKPRRILEKEKGLQTRPIPGPRNWCISNLVFVPRILVRESLINGISLSVPRWCSPWVSFSPKISFDHKTLLINEK